MCIVRHLNHTQTGVLEQGHGTQAAAAAGNGGVGGGVSRPKSAVAASSSGPAAADTMAAAAAIQTVIRGSDRGLAAVASKTATVQAPVNGRSRFNAAIIGGRGIPNKNSINTCGPARLLSTLVRPLPLLGNLWPNNCGLQG